MKQTHTVRRPARRVYATLPVLALLAALALAVPARAQQWTTSTNGASNISNTNTGNVGVGTSAPAYGLHVEGASTAANNYVQGFFRNTGTAFPYGGVGVDGQSQSHVRFFLGGLPKWQWRVGAGTGIDDLRAYNWALNADVLTLTNAGGVGIGTSSPLSRLHVEGGTALGSIRVSGAGMAVMNFKDTAAPVNQKLYQWRSQGGVFRMTLLTDNEAADALANILVANSAGNVGVGTGSPGYTLDVVSGGQWAARFKKTDATHGGILIDSATNTNPNLALSVNGAIKWYMNSNVSAGDSLQFWETTGSFPRMTITQDGKVGIGATASAPTHTLEVGGTINASGAITGSTISATYQDVAEWVPSVQKLEAGTVVVLDSGRTNHVMASAGAYDTKVAGVITAEPGVILGVAGEGKLKVATTGRVKVRVDATRGAIKVGDLLVTSDIEGVAMKSEPISIGGRQMHAPGTIIGKALEPLENGVAEILVLLSLQ
jgi:hypothetical protein